MEKGTLAERYLTRSVTKHIKKHRKIDVGAAVGNDYSYLNGIISTDGYAEEPSLAWTKAMNNFACSGGIVDGVRFLVMLPEDTKESHIKKYMEEFTRLSDENEIQILGGHTQVSDNILKASFLVTVIGHADRIVREKKKVQIGYDIVMTKYAGLFGSNKILDERYEELNTRFSKNFLNEIRIPYGMYSVKKEADILKELSLDEEICYMHDVSHGGVYGALWQLGNFLGKGFLVENALIPIKQGTIEICEFFNINPYLLDGTGSLLFVAEDGEKAVCELARHDIESVVIGKITDGREKIVQSVGGDKRCMTPPDGDEIYHY